MAIERRDQLAIGLIVAAVVSVAAAMWLLLAPGLLGPPAEGEGLAVASSSASGIAPSGHGTPSAALVVDVQGAVKRPGVVLLPPGSRVADALAAAGGYARDADLNAAAASLNLAAPLTDGAQVYVPVIGVAAGPGVGGGGGGGGGSTLVNLNSATPEELEALPGVGPVTVQKIVAARAEQPFATLDELVDREVLNRGQLEEIRTLVTF